MVEQSVGEKKISQLLGEYMEENKKLNIIIENTKIEQEADREHIEELEEENKKLKEELSMREKGEYKYLGD